MSAAGLTQCVFDAGVTEGESVEARLFKECWLSAGAAERVAVSIAGEIGRVGVAGGGAVAVAFLARAALETA